MSKDLVMFDVDGTLVNSLGAEATYYPQACESALAIEEVSSDWGDYEHPSDSGIVQQVVALHFHRDATSEDGRRVEAKFLSLLKEAYPRQPDLCRPVPGAHAAFQHARSVPSTTVSIATAGWSATGLFKLGFAGFDVEGVPLASAHDGVSKQEIMCQRPLKAAQVWPSKMSHSAEVTSLLDRRFLLCSCSLSAGG